MKKLPIGIQTFSKIRDGNCYYVDKTELIGKLIESGECYFLARPRRFGKTLLVDTIQSLFEGRQELFAGLAIHNNWNWNRSYPVIHISFTGGVLCTAQDFRDKIEELIRENSKRLGVKCEYAMNDRRCFKELILKTYEKYGQRVVVLVDEYDKPILDNITDQETARLMRDKLRDFYSVVKDSDSALRFVLLTGVSKFSKVTLFSGLNNLHDITLDRRYATICGYTGEELKSVFHEHLHGANLTLIKEWYNGYNFLGERVYNPFDVLLYLDTREFKPYWFETGTPSFLIDLIHSRQFSAFELEKVKVTGQLMGSFDVDNIDPEPLLFQTGYLTITGEYDYPAGTYYTLGFPNREVKHAFNDALLAKLSRTGFRQDENKLALLAALQSNDLGKLADIFRAFFASIPHDWYRKNELSGYEGYYCSIVYCYFVALGLVVRPEDTTSHGRIDMTVFFADRVYIIEFKVNELCKQPGRALEQIKEKKYADKYQNHETWLIGVEFSSAERNISRFEWEQA